MSPSSDIVVGAGVIGCSIAYHLGRRGISACIVERESIATRASGKAWAMFTYAPAILAYERIYAQSAGGGEGGSIDISAAAPGESVEHWLHLHAASYDRMPELALELAERGGVDIEELDKIETDTDDRELQLRASLFEVEKELDPVNVIFLYQVIERIGEIADMAERVGRRLELLLSH